MDRHPQESSGPPPIEEHLTKFLTASHGKVARAPFDATHQVSNQIVRTLPVRPTILLLGEDADGVTYNLGFGLPPLSRQAPDQRLRFCVQPHTQSHETPLSCNTQVYYSSHALSTPNEMYCDTKADSGNTSSRGFSPECGLSLFGKISAVPDLAMITAGSLDDPSV
jgi:hypothetical protein